MAMRSTERRRVLRILSPDAVGKATDETAAQVMRVGLTFLGTSAFCLLSLLSPDSALLGGSEKINVPLAGPVSFFGFMLLGPAVLIGLRVYLQIYVEHWERLERLARSMSIARAPMLVPFHNLLIRYCSGLIFYLLLPLTMLLFAWKAAVFQAWGSGLLGVAAAVVAIHLMLPLKKFSWPLKAFLSTCVAIVVAVNVAGYGLAHRPFALFRANLSGQWLVGEEFGGADLRFANLTGTNLGSADLRGADLGRANLSSAKLNGTNLSSAKLVNANLGGADLSDADLTHADLEGANLTGARLASADLTHAHLEGANLTGAQLASANLSNALIEADLSSADLSSAKLIDANMRSANLAGANLGFANLTDAELRDASLTGANLGYADLSRADLNNANLSSANLGGTDLTGANLGGADLTGANLGGAKLIGANLGLAYVSMDEVGRANLVDENGNLIEDPDVDPGRAADLGGAKNLTQEQLDKACGSANTKLPKDLTLKLCSPR
ncbi:hypothetical protein A1D31_24425 [Bradyrhizobium liaoningense]|nr:hypothetical protein A1D31_24425 [Bradyrhizobium liaoningense]